jgi:hypothetical protein
VTKIDFDMKSKEAVLYTLVAFLSVGLPPYVKMIEWSSLLNSPDKLKRLIKILLASCFCKIPLVWRERLRPSFEGYNTPFSVTSILLFDRMNEIDRVLRFDYYELHVFLQLFTLLSVCTIDWCFFWKTHNHPSDQMNETFYNHLQCKNTFFHIRCRY